MTTTHFRLGRLPLEPDPNDLLARLLADGGLPRGAELVRLMREFESRRKGARAAPDLLAELAADPGPDGWVFELADALAGRRGLRMTHCERGTDYTAIAVVDESQTASIRPRDESCGGFAAVRDRQGDVEILPRIYRQVCTNGAVMMTHTGAGILHETGSVRDAVNACLSGATTTAAFDVLRRAARTPVSDPIALLRRARVDAPAAEIWRDREEADDSVFGVVNALTASARREPRFARRLDIERGAARVLAAAGLAGRAGPAGHAADRELVGGSMQ